MHLISLIWLQMCCPRPQSSSWLAAVGCGPCRTVVVCPWGWSSVVGRTVWGHGTAEHSVKHKGWYSSTHNLLLVWQWCLLHGMQLYLTCTGTPTTPPPPLTTPPQGGWEQWEGRGGGEVHDAANEHAHISLKKSKWWHRK